MLFHGELYQKVNIILFDHAVTAHSHIIDVPCRYLIALILFLRLIQEVNIFAPKWRELQFGRFLKNGTRLHLLFQCLLYLEF